MSPSVPLTSYLGVEEHASFSPDGSQVPFSWDGKNQDNHDVYWGILYHQGVEKTLPKDVADRKKARAAARADEGGSE